MRIQVYQTNARLALEERDFDSFLQCIGRVRELGEMIPNHQTTESYAEFVGELCC